MIGRRPPPGLNAGHDDDPDAYDAIRQGWLAQRRVTRVQQTLLASEGPVLELGAGTGGLLVQLAGTDPGRHYVGVEPLPGYVEYARGRATPGQVTFLEGTGEDLPELPDDARPVGAVLTNDTLHHVRDVPLVVQRVTAVSRPGTRWLAIEPDRVNPYVWAHHRFTPGEQTFDPRPFDRALTSLGWRRVARERLFLIPPQIRRPPTWMQKLEARLERTPGIAGGLAVEYVLER